VVHARVSIRLTKSVEEWEPKILVAATGRILTLSARHVCLKSVTIGTCARAQRDVECARVGCATSQSSSALKRNIYVHTDESDEETRLLLLIPFYLIIFVAGHCKYCWE